MQREKHREMRRENIGKHDHHTSREFSAQKPKFAVRSVQR
jgi:hypothetical protein